MLFVKFKDSKIKYLWSLKDWTQELIFARQVFYYWAMALSLRVLMIYFDYVICMYACACVCIFITWRSMIGTKLKSYERVGSVLNDSHISSPNSSRQLFVFETEVHYASWACLWTCYVGQAGFELPLGFQAVSHHTRY